MLITLEIQNNLRSDKALRGNEFKLYFSLITYARTDDKIAFPSIRKLTNELGISKPTVINCLKSLQDKGYLLTMKRKSESGDYEKNEYLLIKHIGSQKDLPPGNKNILPVVKDFNQGGKEDMTKVVKDFNPKDIKRKDINKGIKKERFNNFPQREYDFDDLEKRLLGYK